MNNPQEVDSERARNRLESEKREARLKAEKDALSAACEKEAADLGSAWAAVEAAAGFKPGVAGVSTVAAVTGNGAGGVEGGVLVKGGGNGIVAAVGEPAGAPAVNKEA